VSQNGRELLFQKEEKAVRNQADKAGYDDVERIMQSIAGVRGQIKSNVNLELALEMMFVKIRDSLQ
jgi:DNA polymerase-3 subunit delta'